MRTPRCGFSPCLSFLVLALPALAAAQTSQASSAPAAAAPARHFAHAAFQPLFDGESLRGWVTSGGRYDGKAEWTVEDGAIVGREGPNGEGGLLYTAATYRNFLFTAEVWLNYPFDSGVFVRMVPRGGGKGAQVTLDYRPQGEVGGVYADGFLQHNETGKKRFKRGAWNRIEVLCAGEDMQLQAWLNGEQVTDYLMPEGSEGYASRGLIGIQVHGGGGAKGEGFAKFRDVGVLPLPEFDPRQFDVDAQGVLTPTKAGKAAGWQRLFDPMRPYEWEPTGEPSGFVVDGEVLAFSGPSGYLRTKKDYGDFELRFDFKMARMANSGLFLRAPRKRGDPAQAGCEIQLLDDFNWEVETNTKLAAWQFTGSLYHSVAPEVKALHPIGAWNTLQVLFEGSRLKVTLNGQQLYDVDTHEVPTHGWPSFTERPKAGFVGLQRHSHSHHGEPYLWFKNLWVREL